MIKKVEKKMHTTAVAFKTNKKTVLKLIKKFSFNI